jgi:methanogenic corrinoid protein MtbC1
MEAVDILFDLNEIGGTDQSRLMAAETALNSSLDALHDELIEREKRLGMIATVGPVGLKAGSLMATATSALLRSAGFQCYCLGKTQTPLELLRNSEELGAKLVVPMLSSEDVEQQMRNLVDEIQRGGFKSKFLIIPIVPGLAEDAKLPMHATKNSGEAISEALRWAHQRATRGI